jgi:hypothetical protein
VDLTNVIDPALTLVDQAEQLAGLLPAIEAPVHGRLDVHAAAPGQGGVALRPGLLAVGHLERGRHRTGLGSEPAAPLACVSAKMLRQNIGCERYRL